MRPLSTTSGRVVENVGMTQESFSRPGAVDLSGLQPAGGPAGAGGPGGGPGSAAAYAVAVTEQNFQQVLESSSSAPVLLAFESPTRSPESVTLAEDLQTLSSEFEGRFLLGRVDIDASPADRPGDADPLGAAGGPRGPGAPDAAVPGRGPDRGAPPGADPGAAAAHHPGLHRSAPAAQRGGRRRGDRRGAAGPPVRAGAGRTRARRHRRSRGGVPEARGRQPRRHRGRRRAWRWPPCCSAPRAST